MLNFLAGDSQEVMKDLLSAWDKPLGVCIFLKQQQQQKQQNKKPNYSPTAKARSSGSAGGSMWCGASGTGAGTRQHPMVFPVLLLLMDGPGALEGLSEAAHGCFLLKKSDENLYLRFNTAWSTKGPNQQSQMYFISDELRPCMKEHIWHVKCIIFPFRKGVLRGTRLTNWAD